MIEWLKQWWYGRDTHRFIKRCKYTGVVTEIERFSISDWMDQMNAGLIANHKGYEIQKL